MQHQIPKRIIQTARRVEQPLRNRAMMANLRLLNPDYEYAFFDEERVQTFIDQEFPQYRALFDSFQYPIQRYDFFRYLAVYRFGGFYFDLDVMLASDLSSLSESGCVFPFEGLTFSNFLRKQHGMDWEIGNYAFGAAPEHPFLKAVIENCVRAQEDSSWVKPMMRGLPPFFTAEYFILNTTGPGLLSRTFAENPELAKTVTVLFPDDVCDVNNWNRFGNLGIHFMEGSWRTKSSYIIRRSAQLLENFRMRGLMRQSRKLGKTRQLPGKGNPGLARPEFAEKEMQKPLVSILIPAFNAEPWIGDCLRSAIAQTWEPKEIIVVDDGSTDQTLKIAKQFESEGVRVVTQKQQGAAAARNTSLALSRGDYIQWLDADDLLAPDKIALQMNARHKHGSSRILLSSEWGRFIYRYNRAKFNRTELWCDLTPLEWLLRKMGQNLFMQTASWLVSRELTEAAGPWDTRLLSDDDGEYFCRVLLASEGVRFVPEARVYYRGPGLAFRSLSYIGQSNRKLEAHWVSMRLHVVYLRSLQDSAKVREASLNYLRTSLIYFYPERPDIVKEAEDLAHELGGQLGDPGLSWKYSWIKTLFGWRIAKSCQQLLLNIRWSFARSWDHALFRIEKVMSRSTSGAFHFLKRAQGWNQRFRARSFARRPFVIITQTPVISFTFDDFPRSALLTGGAILESFGLAGTYYASLGIMGRETPTGSIFLPEDLRVLLERGHELGCHTFNHCHAWDTQASMFEDGVIQNHQKLNELLPDASFKTLSYPISVPRVETKRRISKYFACCRCGGQTYNTGETDLNYLSAFFLEQSRDNPEFVKNLIDQNRQARGWLIFATHDICEDPTRWGCTPGFFEEIVRYAVNSGARILPVYQAYNALRARSSP
jgi:glycosyltransferase involved in cell wall biosynthesis